MKSRSSVALREEVLFLPSSDALELSSKSFLIMRQSVGSGKIVLTRQLL
jgi:hypothetical protein